MRIEEPGLFGDLKVHYTEESPNPMVKAHGPGPEGARCGSCAHLRGLRYSRTYWKCELRGDLTHGPATDQRKRWPACGQYVERG